MYPLSFHASHYFVFGAATAPPFFQLWDNRTASNSRASWTDAVPCHQTTHWKYRYRLRGKVLWKKLYVAVDWWVYWLVGLTGTIYAQVSKSVRTCHLVEMRHGVSSQHSRNTNTSEWYFLITHASLQTTTTQCTVCTWSKHFREYVTWSCDLSDWWTSTLII